MKKVFIFLLMISFLFIKVSALENVYIEDIELENKTDSTTEISVPSIDGLSINFNLKFTKINDYARYKIIIKNNTNRDFELSNETSFSNSEYVKYEYEFDNNDKVLKANSTKLLYIKIIYNKQVEETSFNENGTYTEEKEMNVELVLPEVNETNTTNETNETNETTNTIVEKNETVTNPKTGPRGTIFLVLGILLVAIAVVVYLIDNKPIKETLIIIGFLLILPLSLKAIEKLSLTVNTHIEIEKTYEVIYSIASPMFYTDEELEIFEKEDSTECIILYANSIKYNRCGGMIYKEKYAPGERVELKSFPYRRFNYYSTICQLEMDGSYVCPEGTDITTGTIRQFKYDYSSNDLEVMNFSDFWETSDTSISVVPGVTFTMPKHDVTFVYRVSK